MLLPTLSHEINDALGAGVTIPGPAFPVAEFSFLGDELAVDFGDQSTGGGVEWLWDFGDGSYSYLQHPSHVYAAPGSYQVTLTVRTPAGLSISITHEVTVPTFASLSARITAAAGKVLTLPPGIYELDADAPVPSARVVLQHGAVIEVPVNRELGAELDFSQGGRIKPASGVTVELTGKIHCPQLHHAFDVSDGGAFFIEKRLPFMTPDNFGASGDGVTSDSAAVAAVFGVLAEQAVRIGGGHVFCPNKYVFVPAAPIEIQGGTRIAGLGRNASQLLNKSTTGVNMFAPVGGAFKRGWTVAEINLVCDVQAGHIVDPDSDAGISDGGWSHVDAKVLNPLKSIWHQAITQRGTFFFSFRDCRLECGTQAVRSRVPGIDIDGVDNSFSSVWFTQCRFQCNHSLVPFLRATNTAGGNPLKQVVLECCAVEQCQNGLVQAQGTIGFVIGKLTFYDSVSPLRRHFLEFQTGTGGLGNDFPSVDAYMRTGATLGAVADELIDLVSLTQAAGVATGTTGAAHSWVNGDQIELVGALPAGYENGNGPTVGVQTITVTGPTTFTYPVLNGLASPATLKTPGVPIAARRVQRAVDTLTQAAGIATCNTKQAHNLEPGMRAFVGGFDQAGYNGMVDVLTTPDADTFTYAVDPGTASPATGTGWAGIGSQDGKFGPDDSRAFLKNLAGGSQDAEFDVNDASSLILGKNPELKLMRVPANTSSALGIGSGASIETASMKTDALAARTTGADIEVASIVAAAAGVEFGGNADIADLRVATAALDFPSVAANGGTQELDVALAGVGTTWRAEIQPQSNIPAGLIPDHRAIADAVRIRLTNVTGAPIDPGSITFLVTAKKH